MITNSFLNKEKQFITYMKPILIHKDCHKNPFALNLKNCSTSLKNITLNTLKQLNKPNHPKVQAYNDTFNTSNLMDPKISVDYWKVCGFVFFGAINFLVAVNKDPSLPSGKIDMC